MAFTRSRMSSLNFKSPAGTTTASAGAGGAAPRVQAPMPKTDDSWVDFSKLGGILGMLTTPKTTTEISLEYTPATDEEEAAQRATMTQEDVDAMNASQFTPAWGHATPVITEDTRSPLSRAWDWTTSLFK